jgi:hypothetical protein
MRLGIGVSGRRVLSRNGTRHGDFDIPVTVPALRYPRLSSKLAAARSALACHPPEGP